MIHEHSVMQHSFIHSNRWQPLPHFVSLLNGKFCVKQVDPKLFSPTSISSADSFCRTVSVFTDWLQEHRLYPPV